MNIYAFLGVLGAAVGAVQKDASGVLNGYLVLNTHSGSFGGNVTAFKSDAEKLYPIQADFAGWTVTGARKHIVMTVISSARERLSAVVKDLNGNVLFDTGGEVSCLPGYINVQ